MTRTAPQSSGGRAFACRARTVLLAVAGACLVGAHRGRTEEPLDASLRLFVSGDEAQRTKALASLTQPALRAGPRLLEEYSRAEGPARHRLLVPLCLVSSRTELSDWLRTSLENGACTRVEACVAASILRSKIESDLASALPPPPGMPAPGGAGAPSRAKGPPRGPPPGRPRKGPPPPPSGAGAPEIAPDIRRRLDALREKDLQVVDRLAQAEDDPVLRRLAAEMLGALGGTSVPPALVRLIADPVCVVRYEAIGALGALPCDDSRRLVDGILASPDLSRVHERAAAAGAAGGLRYVPGLVRGLADFQERVQIRAIRELANFETLPAETLDLLQRIAASPSVLGARDEARAVLRSAGNASRKDRK